MKKKRAKAEPIVEELVRRWEEGDGFAMKPGDPLFKAIVDRVLEQRKAEPVRLEDALELVTRGIMGIVHATIAGMVTKPEEKSNGITMSIDRPQLVRSSSTGESIRSPGPSQSTEIDADGAAELLASFPPELSRFERATLIALVQHREGLSRKQILLFTRYRSSGDTSTAFAELARRECIFVGRDRLVITGKGITTLGAYAPLPLGSALRAAYLQSFTAFDSKALRVLFDEYPQSISRGEILDRTNYASSGDTSTAFARWVAIGIAVKHGRELVAARELFDES